MEVFFGGAVSDKTSYSIEGHNFVRDGSGAKVSHFAKPSMLASFISLTHIAVTTMVANAGGHAVEVEIF